ncbi:hypothetical protein HPB47_016112 [Ixodes persulcatus]|uniref:Uncharacterized protein n=1 Tax=Ixodes persulcatus TaxID=34615 RepID=A0AC60QRP4_IXOPE|nr:hypothetical protein HPB47_016112 [Ixodes persulcatus]
MMQQTDSSALHREQIAAHIRELLIAAPIELAEVLDGSAKLWFRFAREFTSWGSFVTAFHSQFAPVDKKKRLKGELRKRTQHPEENLKQFIYVISSYYDRIGEPVTDAQKVERVLRQMHPQFRDLVEGRTFATLKELADAADGLMERVWRRLQYVPPPPPPTFKPSGPGLGVPKSNGDASDSSSSGDESKYSSLDHAHPRCSKRVPLVPASGGPATFVLQGPTRCCRGAQRSTVPHGFRQFRQPDPTAGRAPRKQL